MINRRYIRALLRRFISRITTGHRVFAIGFGLIIFVSLLGLLSAAWGKKEATFGHIEFTDNMVLQGDSIIRKGKSDTSLHAGADEMYPDNGYDEDGWSLRGYMSSHEMKGKHIKGMDALQRFEQRKARVKAAFVDTMKRKALEICNGTSVPPSIVCAQAILETNFGTSRLKHVANNLFGHMYKGNLASRGISGNIKAYDKDKYGNTREYKFRKYTSVWWSLRHHVELLEYGYAGYRIGADIPERERWMAALCKCKDSRMRYEDSKAASYLYAGACAWPAKDGETSRYVAELRYIIRLYNLDKLDEQWVARR